MKKLKVKKQSVEKKEKDSFSLTIQFPDTKQSAKGKTVVDCLNKIPVSYVKAKGIFKVISGKKKAEMVLLPFQIRRLLTSENNKIFFQKKILAIIK